MSVTLTASETSARAVALGRSIKRINALTALLCGGLPAAALALFLSNSPGRWLIGFFVGLLWANAFEYVYHRFLLHLPTSFFGQRHLLHHASVGTPTEAEHVNLGGSPIWVVFLFASNGLPVLLAELLFRFGLAQGIFLGFAAYFIAVEEIHWRIHLGEWLPRFLDGARRHHFAHHDRADQRFNIFLPLFDWLFSSLP
jgi:hypothetical protein